MTRKRPSAFEVSFPDDVRQEEALRKKREEDEKERRRHEEVLAAQQVNQKKLKRKEREQLKKKELRDGLSLNRSVEIVEKDDSEMEVDSLRVTWFKLLMVVDTGGLRYVIPLACEENTSGSTYVYSRPQAHSDSSSLLNTWSTATEYYFAKPDEIRETADIALEGEDELADDDDGSDEEGSSTDRRSQTHVEGGQTQKPIRLLTDFTIFDARHRNEYVVLSQIEEEDGVDRRFEAAGSVVPFYIDEQDLVGEDGNHDGHGGGDNEEMIEPIVMRIGPVLGYSLDWRQINE